MNICSVAMHIMQMWPLFNHNLCFLYHSIKSTDHIYSHKKLNFIYNLSPNDNLLNQVIKLISSLTTTFFMVIPK